MAGFLLSVILILAAIAGLALGVLCGRRPPSGSCGGVAGSGRCVCDPQAGREPSP